MHTNGNGSRAESYCAKGYLNIRKLFCIFYIFCFFFGREAHGRPFSPHKIVEILLDDYYLKINHSSILNFHSIKRSDGFLEEENI